MEVREAVPQDAGALAQIFYDAIRAVDVYSHAERAAWAPDVPTAAQWAVRLDGLLTFVAANAQGAQGFMSMRISDGYLDLAFVAPTAQGQGVASHIYAVLENRARATGLRRLHSEASLAFQPVLLRQGWQVLRPNSVTRRGQTLNNAVMEKHLT